MQHGYIPKDQRKKILFLSDDMRVTSGVGVMSREIIEGTAHRYNWVQVGAAVTHPEVGKILDMSDAVNNETGLTDSSVRIYPYNGYGDSRLVRQLMETEKPDAILHFTDPRYWIWLYQMEHELRQKIPLFFYAIWDDLPYPYYNENFYRSDDWIGCISKQTYNIVKHVSRKDPRAPWSLSYVPHGVNIKKFFPLPDDNQEVIDIRKQLFGDADVKFVAFYNSRNIRRKQTSDILLAFSLFMKKLSPEERSKCRLVLHTQLVDEHGTDLPVVIRDVIPDMEPYIIFSKDRIEAKHINLLYNVADVTINLSSNEGFGLGTCESMMAGTPIIVNITGGLQDQCGFDYTADDYIDIETLSNKKKHNHTPHGVWVNPIWPAATNINGSPLTPYIFDDRVNDEEVADKIMSLYMTDKQLRKHNGLKGREFAIKNLSSKVMCDAMSDGIETTIKNFTPRERFNLYKIV